MLVDEVEVEEAVHIAECRVVADGMALVRIAQAGEDVPGRRNGEEQQQARHEAHLAPAPPFAGEHQPRHCGREEEDRSDQPFGQRREGERRPAHIEERRPAVLQPSQKAVEREPDEEGEQRLRDIDAGEEKDADAGQQRERRIECGPFAEGAPSPVPRKNGGREHAQRHGKVRGEDVIAEDVIVDGGEPVGKRRLFQIADAIDLQASPNRRRAPCAARHWHARRRRRPAMAARKARQNGRRTRPGAGWSRRGGWKGSAQVQHRCAPEVRWDET